MKATVIQSKMCSSCKETLPIAAFSAAKSYADGYRGQCRICRISYTKSYVKRTGWKQKPRRNRTDTATNRRARMRKKYGISIERYDEMLAGQDGKCGICGREETIARRLAVDHCHTTGRVRGLLCYKCNTAIGLFSDDPQALRAAATYLEVDRAIAFCAADASTVEAGHG